MTTPSTRAEAATTSSATEHQVTALGSRWLFYVWVILFVGVIAACVLLAPNRERFWLWWEVGTLGTATVYTTLFYVRLFWNIDAASTALYKNLSEGVVGFVPIPCLVAVIALGAATAFASEWLEPPLTPITSHVGSLVCIVIATACFCLIDYLFGFRHQNTHVQHEFRQGLFLNGVPVFVAFVVLLVFVWQFDVDTRWSIPLKAFVGGAVAFEMLISNTVFAVMFYKPRAL